MMSSLLQWGEHLAAAGWMTIPEFRDRLPFLDPVKRWPKVEYTLDTFGDPHVWPERPRDRMDEASWVWRTCQRNARIKENLLTACDLLQSRLRARRRTAIIKEDLMAECWHPRRVAKMVDAGRWDLVDD